MGGGLSQTSRSNVPLHHGAGIAGVGFQMEDARGMGVERRVLLHLFSMPPMTTGTSQAS